MGKRALPPITCACGCGVVFVPKTAGGQFYSRACANKMHGLSHRGAHLRKLHQPSAGQPRRKR